MGTHAFQKLIGMTRTFDERRKQYRIQFEKPRDARIMAIDGTWYRDCQLLDMSEDGARITLEGSAANLVEFFLLLSTFGSPVYRRCKLAWVDGTQVGVAFEKSQIKGSKPSRHEAVMP